MNRRRVQVVLAGAVVFGLAGASIAMADHGGKKNDRNGAAQLSAHLISYNETPSLNSPGHAELTATMTADSITFTLTYADLTGPPTQSHIHIGQKGVAGGVSIFFCGPGPAGTPPCPASNSGTVTGTRTAADVIGPVAQGFNPGDLASVEKAILAGFSYANIHTARFPAGEIRGQIRAGGDDDNGNH